MDSEGGVMCIDDFKDDRAKGTLTTNSIDSENVLCVAGFGCDSIKKDHDGTVTIDSKGRVLWSADL